MRLNAHWSIETAAERKSIQRFLNGDWYEELSRQFSESLDRIKWDLLYAGEHGYHEATRGLDLAWEHSAPRTTSRRVLDALPAAERPAESWLWAVAYQAAFSKALREAIASNLWQFPAEEDIVAGFNQG